MMKTVIVVGGGLAGLSAAIEAHEGNVRVILIEKESKIGGNSIKASSGINAMVSKEDRESFIQDTLESGGGESQVDLVHKLVDDSRPALDWLIKQDDSLHLSLVSQCGGHSVARTHRCPSENGRPVPVGWKLIESLKSRLNDLPNVIILTQTRVLELIVRQERICGVRLSDPLGEREMVANAVILTSGGFGGQTSKQSDGQDTLLNEFAPQLVNMATTNGPWANGDGIRLGLSVGASTRNMANY
ncbi:hypothetical protein G6F56_012458 [Rhizopus delemar]|nr:hypothetical protein G6F56_012458 [Rhizopus delemar]